MPDCRFQAQSAVPDIQSLSRLISLLIATGYPYGALSAGCIHWNPLPVSNVVFNETENPFWG